MASKRQLAEQVVRILAGGTPRPEFPIKVQEVMYAVEQERDKMIEERMMQKILLGDYSVEGHLLTTLKPIIRKETFPDGSYVYFSFLKDTRQVVIDSDTGAITGGSERRAINPISLPDNRGIHTVSENNNNLPITFSGGLKGTSSYVPVNAHALSGLYYGSAASAFLQNNQGNHFHPGYNSIKRDVNGYYISQNKLYYTKDFGFANAFNETDAVNAANLAQKQTGLMQIKLIGASRSIYNNDNLPMPPEMEAEIVQSLVQLFSVMVGSRRDNENDNIS